MGLVTLNNAAQHRRVGGRLARLIAVVVLAFSGLIAMPAISGTAYAATATINCDTASQRQTRQERTDWTTCQRLVGTADCVWNNRDGTYTIALGYINSTADNLFAEIPDSNGNGGINNALTASGGYADNPEHVSTFWVGTSNTAFTVTWKPTYSGDPVTWNLMGHTYTFTYGGEPACKAKPVPIMGSVAVAGIGLALLVVLFAFVNFRHERRLREAATSQSD
ncbi:MAG: hypothetical protein ACRDV3_15055 [Acidothermaceae bacterium]